MLHIMKCPDCGKYTLSKECGCKGKCVEPRPPKYSPEDNYGKYRREAKEQERIEQGLI